EDDAAHDPQYVAGTAHRGAVEPGPVGPPGDDLQLDERLAVRPTDGLGPDHRTPGPVPDQRRVGGDSVGGEGSQVGDRLDDVGLPLPVVADEGGDSAVE